MKIYHYKHHEIKRSKIYTQLGIFFKSYKTDQTSCLDNQTVKKLVKLEKRTFK